MYSTISEGLSRSIGFMLSFVVSIQLVEIVAMLLSPPEGVNDGLPRSDCWEGKNNPGHPASCDLCHSQKDSGFDVVYRTIRSISQIVSKRFQKESPP